MGAFEEVAKQIVDEENDTRVKICKNNLPYYIIIDQIGQAFSEWYRDESGEPVQVINSTIKPMKGKDAQYIASKQICLFQKTKKKTRGRNVERKSGNGRPH